MLYLDSMVIHNFKSFKHASIKFKKGFNCIVGPNGSGKSAICDSILFAMGESSLKRLRVGNTMALINKSASPSKSGGPRRAYVKLVFSGDVELEVLKTIKSNNKVSYRLDGRRVTKQEVLTALRSYNAMADTTNIIAQGEINHMESLTPRERRELIDAASGISEFDEKRDASLNELEKVDARVREAQIELDLRKGFLSDLEKQKDDAEAYMALRDYIKRGTYTILKATETEIAGLHDKAVSDIRVVEGRVAAINSKLLEIESASAKLSKERDDYSRELNEKSLETSSAGHRLEEVLKEIAVKESQSKSIKERVKEKEQDLSSMVGELDGLRAGLARNTEQLDEISAQLREMAPLADSMMPGGAGTESLIEQSARLQAGIYEQQQLLSDLASSLMGLDAEAKALAAQRADAEAVLLQLNSAANEPVAQGRMEELSKGKLRIAKEMGLVHKRIEELRSAQLDLDSKSLELKEQLASLGAGSDSRIDEAVSGAIGGEFLGRVRDLCTYDERYDLAVGAAASGRLNYLVVESADAADRAIRVLKAKQLGRASFIPISDLVIGMSDPVRGLDPLLSHVRFEKRLAGVFNYVFSNTYLVESIAEAKRAGFGRHRFVTYDGELVEQHGIITGGSNRRQSSRTSINSRLSAIAREKSEAAEAARRMETEIEVLRKEYSRLEAEEIGASFEAKRSRQEGEERERKRRELGSRISDLSALMAAIDRKLASKRSEHNAARDRLESMRHEGEALLSRLKGAEQKKEGKHEAEKYKELQASIEALRVRHAATSKERDLNSQRRERLEEETAAGRAEIAEEHRRLAMLDEELKELARARDELQEELKSHGAEYSRRIAQINEVGSRISKMMEERGRLGSELSRTERELNEVNTRRAQLQVRLGDIRAELNSYAGTEPVIGEEIRSIEERLVSARSDMERLGNVNLKAPEVYSSKKLEVEEADAKLSTLSKEKESIINMINEIDRRKLSVFKDTFNKVDENFRRLHDYIFDTQGHLELDDQKEPLKAGLNIVIGGRSMNISVEQKSGGERALLLLILIFSIQAINPLSFYLFDEIDVSLDKENVKKLSKLMAELSRKSQMILVSHNDTMITSAEAAIGVVKRDDISAVVGLHMVSNSVADVDKHG